MSGSVYIHQQWCPKAKREQDKSLMLVFEHKYQKKKKKLAQLNRCSIWLRVTTLSNVTDANGIQRRKHPHRATTYIWRRQNNIDKKSWKTWCTALKATFTTDGAHLHLPLEDWSKENPPSQKWLTYKVKESLFMPPLQQGKT